jgi:hypothetical protein
MFTLFKVFMAKCILITFILKQVNIQTSNHGMFAARKSRVSKRVNIQTSNHGMFAAH